MEGDKFSLRFDASLTYRWDSDGIFIYGACKRRDVPLANLTDYAALKTADAYWMVSNWGPARRLEIYAEMALSLEIRVMGHHAGATVPACDEPDSDDDCSKYFFYLAFENSECDQYISEKPFRALRYGNVPIVLGGMGPADYSEILPPRSFIHIDDFVSINSLVDYLNFLKANPEEYNKYHAWRRDYELMGTYLDYGICGMCDSLAAKHLTSKWDRKTVGEWWFESSCDNRDSSCEDACRGKYHL